MAAAAGASVRTCGRFTVLIRGCDYIRNCRTNKKKDTSSLSSLVSRVVLSQSDCIKLGLAVEKLMVDMINHFGKGGLQSIKTKNTKGKKERDHLFVNETTKMVYYAELKSNLNLDTEKSKATYNKVLHIYEELKREYPGYTIKPHLVGLRYTSKSVMPTVISGKYTPVNAYLCGMNDYLVSLGLESEIQFTDAEYVDFINEVAVEMVTCND